jgi:hypothetical protein
MRRRPGVADPAPQVIDPPVRDQLPQASPVRLAQRRPTIDDPPVDHHPGPFAVARIESHQSHRARA